jgi:hypothetical protein
MPLKRTLVVFQLNLARFFLPVFGKSIGSTLKWKYRKDVPFVHKLTMSVEMDFPNFTFFGLQNSVYAEFIYAKTKKLKQ